MKNLFAINKTNDKNAMDFDENPYLTARVSDEVREKLKGAFSVMEEEAAPRELTEEEKAIRKKGSRYWLICLGCLLLSVALFFGGSRVGLFEAVPLLHFVVIALLVAAIVFNVKARRISRKQTETNLQFDFSEASKKLEAAAAEAARELGVPDTALAVDVFPYHYKLDGDAVLRVGKKGKFDNLAVSVFVKEEKLCFATAQELFCVPLRELRGYREYDEDFEIDMWLKPEEVDSDKYKDFGLRKSGFLSCKGHGYYGLKIGEEAFEVLIPCYDWAPVRELLKTCGVA